MHAILIMKVMYLDLQVAFSEVVGNVCDTDDAKRDGGSLRKIVKGE